MTLQILGAMGRGKEVHEPEKRNISLSLYRFATRQSHYSQKSVLNFSSTAMNVSCSW